MQALVNQPIFFMVVFIIQMIIAVVNYIAAYACWRNDQVLGLYSNLLAGISWTLTGFYKLGEYFLAI